MNETNKTINKRLIFNPDSIFFKSVYPQVCKQIHYPKTEATIIYVNKELSQIRNKPIKEKYKFMFDYPNNNDEIVGTEIYFQGYQL